MLCILGEARCKNGQDENCDKSDSPVGFASKQIH